MLPDIEIARQTQLLPIEEVAAKLGIDAEHIEHYGRAKAKISRDFCHSLEGSATGKLVLVSSIKPTPAGEGKTTTTIGLGDALNRIGKRATVCLREPSSGAGFAVVLTGDIMTMPGLPKQPSAESVDFDEAGRITGLF